MVPIGHRRNNIYSPYSPADPERCDFQKYAYPTASTLACFRKKNQDSVDLSTFVVAVVFISFRQGSNPSSEVSPVLSFLSTYFYRITYLPWPGPYADLKERNTWKYEIFPANKSSQTSCTCIRWKFVKQWQEAVCAAAATRDCRIPSWWKNFRKRGEEKRSSRDIGFYFLDAARHYMSFVRREATALAPP